VGYSEVASDHFATYDRVLDVRPTRVLDLVRGRNAWHSTWVSHYFSGSEVFTEFVDASDAARNMRRQGSVFYITEYPALYMRTLEYGVLVIDRAGGWRPFATWHEARSRGSSPVLVPGCRARSALSTLAHPRSLEWRDGANRGDDHVAIFRLAVQRDVPRLGAGPFRTYSSRATDPNEPWGFNYGENPNMDPRPVVRMARAFGHRAQEVGPEFSAALAAVGRRRAGGARLAALEDDYSKLERILIDLRAN